MTFSFHPEAETEFLEAIDYYEDCERGLGYDFLIEVLATIQNIVNYPTAWPTINFQRTKAGFRKSPAFFRVHS